MLVNRLFDQLAHPRNGMVCGRNKRRRRWPVAPCLYLAVRGNCHGMTRRQRLNICVEGLAFGAGAPREKGGDRRAGNRFPPTSQESHLRAEANMVASRCVIERLYAQS